MCRRNIILAGLFCSGILLLVGCNSYTKACNDAINVEKSVQYETMGTDESGYFIITEEEQLLLIGSAQYPMSAKYKLGSNIAVSGLWNPIGTEDTPFTGEFDGNGYIIKDLRIASNNHVVGFFGYAENAKVENITLENVQTEKIKFFPIVYQAVQTDIVNCYINGNHFGDDNDNEEIEEVMGFDQAEEMVDSLWNLKGDKQTVSEYNQLICENVFSLNDLQECLEFLTTTEFYSSDDPEYEFVRYSLPASCSEISSDGTVGKISNVISRERTSGTIILENIEFSAYLKYELSYSLVPEKICVEDRDEKLVDIDTRLKKYFFSVDELDIENGNILNDVDKKADEICSSFSDEDIQFHIHIQIFILAPDGEYHTV